MSPKRRRPLAQQPWHENPKILARVGLVWEMHLKRVPIQDIRKLIGSIIEEDGTPTYGTPSYSTVRQDVRWGRITLHKAHAEFVKEQSEEMVALRNLIIRKTIKAWEDLEALQDATIIKGHTKEGEDILVTESPVAIARAKADLARALSSTVSDMERLLGLRQEKGGDINIDKVAILRIEGMKALPALTDGQDEEGQDGED